MTTYTRGEQDRIARALYTRRWTGFLGVVPYDALPSDRQWFWRGAAMAAIREAEDVNAERREQWSRERRTTNRVTA